MNTTLLKYSKLMFLAVAEHFSPYSFTALCNTHDPRTRHPFMHLLVAYDIRWKLLQGSLRRSQPPGELSSGYKIVV